MDNFDLKKYLAEGRLFEEDFKNPILDKYLELKKSIDYKTVFPTDLQSFIDSLDNTEREGLESDLAEDKLNEEVDVLSNEFLQDIQDTMKMYYKMDVDMDDIKDWVNMYYIGYNSEYDEGPGDVDYEGNEFGSEDYESEKKELVFDTAEREDFYMHLNPDAESTFPNLQESKKMDNFDLRKYLAEGRLFENTQNQISSRIVKLGKEAGISSDDIEEYVDGLESSFEPDAYKNITDKELLKDLKLAVKNLAEGNLNENEEQGYTLYTTNVEYDNGKTGYMYQLVNSEDREENEIGFDQLYFDDEDNRLEMGIDFKDFDQSSYQEEEVSAEEAMKIYSKVK